MLSRVAGSLYWLSRYIERAENNARILDVNLQLMLDFEDHPDRGVDAHWSPIINSLETSDTFRKLYNEINEETVTDFLTFSKENSSSIYSCIATARENARMVREQISSEMWEQLNLLYLMLKSNAAREMFDSSPYELYKKVVDASQLFQGVTDATMTHGEGWDFMQFGKFLERADSSSRILDVKYHILLPSGEQVGGNVDSVQWMAVLKSVSAMEAYCKIHVGQVVPWKVADFLILHDEFPRSLRFCIDALDNALHRISGSPPSHYQNEAERLAGRLRSDLEFGTVDELFREGLHQFLDRTQSRLNEIAAACDKVYCDSLIPDVDERIRALEAERQSVG